MGITGDQAVWEAETEGLELLQVTIGEMLDQQARKYADREALVYHYPERGLQLRLTYRQYRDEANRLARDCSLSVLRKGSISQSGPPMYQNGRCSRWLSPKSVR